MINIRFAFGRVMTLDLTTFVVMALNWQLIYDINSLHLCTEGCSNKLWAVFIYQASFCGEWERTSI